MRSSTNNRGASIAMIHPHARKSEAVYSFLPVVLCALMAMLTACSSSPASSSTQHTTVSTTGGSIITYNTGPQDVLIRTFYGGGILRTLEISPDLTIYGHGPIIIGPRLPMRQGKLSVDNLQP